MRERGALKLKSEPGAGIGEPGIVRGEIGVRHVIKKTRNAHIWAQLITKLDAFTEKRRRTECLAARWRAIVVTVL